MKTVYSSVSDTFLDKVAEWLMQSSLAGGNLEDLVRGFCERIAASGLPIPARAFVVCDFGVILGGYCSDMTRTVYVGRVPAEARAFYNAVREAQQAALDTVRPGVQVSKVDRAARKILQSARLER